MEHTFENNGSEQEIGLACYCRLSWTGRFESHCKRLFSNKFWTPLTRQEWRTDTINFYVIIVLWIKLVHFIKMFNPEAFNIEKCTGNDMHVPLLQVYQLLIFSHICFWSYLKELIVSAHINLKKKTLFSTNNNQVAERIRWYYIQCLDTCKNYYIMFMDS